MKRYNEKNYCRNALCGKFFSGRRKAYCSDFCQVQAGLIIFDSDGARCARPDSDVWKIVDKRTKCQTKLLTNKQKLIRQVQKEYEGIRMATCEAKIQRLRDYTKYN